MFVQDLLGPTNRSSFTTHLPFVVSFDGGREIVSWTWVFFPGAVTRGTLPP